VGQVLASEISQHPLYPEIANSSLYTNQVSSLRKACENGDLLPHYQFLNSPEYLLKDVDTQWGFFLRTRLHSGLDRFRLALWEVRNLNIASNIRRASAQYPGGRILVIVGASHKPFLDSYLLQIADIKLVNLNDELFQINSTR
jgi:hypothetical protein